MRTTVDLDDVLLARAKRLALSEKRTVGSVLSEALSAYLASRRGVAREAPFELIVRGDPRGPFPTAAELADVQEDEDRAALGLPQRKRAPS